MRQINYVVEGHENDKRNFIEEILAKINPSKYADFSWERWKKKNLNAKGVGGFIWSIARFIIIVGISFMILYPFLVKTIVSFMSTADLEDKTVTNQQPCRFPS